MHLDCKGPRADPCFPPSPKISRIGERLWERRGSAVRRLSYREDESVFEVGELFVALLAAEHAVLLVDHFLVAVLAGTRLVEAVLLAQEHNGGEAGEVISLKQSTKKKEEKKKSVFFFSPPINACFHVTACST